MGTIHITILYNRNHGGGGKKSEVKEEHALITFQKGWTLDRDTQRKNKPEEGDRSIKSIPIYTQISLPGKEDLQLQCCKHASFPTATLLVGCNHKK